MNFARRHFLKETLIGAPLAMSSMPMRAAAISSEANIVDLLDIDWHDKKRMREVPVRLYLPRSAAMQNQVPLIIFSHGLGGSRYGYSYLGQGWAKNGYASLHLQHIGSDQNVWFKGSPFLVIDRVHAAVKDHEAIERFFDFQFALDQLLESWIGKLINRDQIFAAGHSFGANTVMLGIGAEVKRHGQLLKLKDSRIKGAILISAPPFYGESSIKQILNPVKIPTLHVTATQDVINIPRYFSPSSDRIDIFNAIGSEKKILAVFDGGSHSIFTDRVGTRGVLLNGKVKKATSELTISFIHNELEKDDQALEAWPSLYANILSRFTHFDAHLATPSKI